MSFMTELDKSISRSLEILNTEYDPDSEKTKDARARVRLALHILPHRRAEIIRGARLIIPKEIGFFSIAASFLPKKALNSEDSALADAIFEYFEAALDCEKSTDQIVAWSAVGYLWKIKGKETQIIDLCQRKIIALTKKDRSSLKVTGQRLQIVNKGTAFAPAGEMVDIDLGSAIADYAIINLGQVERGDVTEEAFDACIALVGDDIKPYHFEFLNRMAGGNDSRIARISRFRNPSPNVIAHEESPISKAILPEDVLSELDRINVQLTEALFKKEVSLEDLASSVNKDSLMLFMRKLISLIRDHVNSYRKMKSENTRRRRVEKEDLSKGQPYIHFVNWLIKLCNHIGDAEILCELANEVFNISRGLPLGFRSDLSPDGYDKLTSLALTRATELDPKQTKRFLKHAEDDIKHLEARVSFLSRFGLLDQKLGRSILKWGLNSLKKQITNAEQASRMLNVLIIIRHCLQFLETLNDFQLETFISAGKTLRKIAAQHSGTNIERNINFGLDFFAHEIVRLYAEIGRTEDVDKIVDSLGEEVLP